MKCNNILHITDNYLYYKNKKRDIIKYKLPKDIVYGGKICNVQKFINIYNKFVNENHLNNSLLGDTIKVIVATNYQESDKIFLKYILNTFNYRKIYIEKEIKYLKLNNTTAYISVYDNYLNITFKDKYNKINNIYIETNCFKNTNDLLEYINYSTNDLEVCLFGSGELIKEIFSSLEEKFNKKTYIYNNHETYIISKEKESN